MKDKSYEIGEGFSYLIARRRKEFALTQSQIAAKAGLSVATLSQYETGALNPRSMRVGNLINLARALDLSASFLVSLIEGSLLISEGKQ